ncbi:MAG TPA: AAA family ATPase [Hyphomicrobium zavarzinii]|nr:AAA family ATPase [Hyphomicrobium zavarzinii]
MAALIRHLAETPAFEGIGWAKAARLAEVFGPDLPRLLAGGDPNPLATVVGEREAETLVRAWAEDLARGDVVVWLEERGFDPRLAGKVMRLWGAEAAQRIRSQPYAMMALASWPTVDAAAKRIGTAEDDPARLIAAVEAVLYERLQSQHTWTSDATLRARLRKLLGPVGAVLTSRAVDHARDVGAVVSSDGGWQPAGAAMMEAYVASRLLTALSEPAQGDLIAREVPEEEIDQWLDGARREVGVELNEEQRAAVRLAVRSRFGMVLGGAGVGKTTVLKAVCAANEAFGRVVHQMALAGRAAVRMREATGRPASTIAAFLKACEAKKVALGPESLIVVDESSMLDLPTLYRLLRHMPEESRLLLVGDEAQLGPIGFGLTLHAFAEAPQVPAIRLRRIYRQAATSGIPVVAAAIREGQWPTLEHQVGLDGVALVSTDSAPTADHVVDVVERLGGFGHDLRILTPLRAGDTGLEALNGLFHRLLSVGRARVPGRDLALGEPVMFGRNDYRRDLRNGSLGVVVRIDDAVEVDFDGERHEFVGSALDDLSLAYAVTVHKAQGSQFRSVVVPVTRSRLLDRSLIYTAVTRATDRVVLIGEADVLAEAVRQPSAAGRRETGLGRPAFWRDHAVA